MATPDPPGVLSRLRGARYALWALEAAALRFIAARPGTRRPERWLVLGYGAIGDVLFLLPALQGLRLACPKGRLVFLANRSPITDELVPATGLFDEVKALDSGWEEDTAAGRRAAADWIEAQGFEGVMLSLSSPAHYFQGAIARIPVRVGHCTRLEPPVSFGPLRWLCWVVKRGLVTGELSRRLSLTHKAWIEPGGEHAVRRNLRLLDAAGIPSADVSPKPLIAIPPKDREFAQRSVTRRDGRKLIGVHLGRPDNPYSKIWAAGRLGRICRRLSDGGADVVLVGGRGEAAAVESARRSAGLEIPSLAGRCSLLETFAVIASCDLFLANDTGLAKAAMALGVPTATIWGPTDPAELGVLWETGKHLDIRTGISCSPCVRLGMPFAREGIDFSDCGHHDCLTRLGEEEVFEALHEKYDLPLGA